MTRHYPVPAPPTSDMEAPLKKRELWDESNMVSAMEAVSSNSMKVAEAARHFSVPRKSLENRVKKRITVRASLCPL